MERRLGYFLKVFFYGILSGTCPYSPAEQANIRGQAAVFKRKLQGDSAKQPADPPFCSPLSMPASLRPVADGDKENGEQDKKHQPQKDQQKDPHYFQNKKQYLYHSNLSPSLCARNFSREKSPVVRYMSATIFPATQSASS